jgi:hypothetical protein
VQCRFRAYASLALGAQLWLGHHQKIATSNPDYLRAINAGDIPTVAHLLKVAHYYTAPESNYANTMASQRKIVDQTLGPIS